MKAKVIKIIKETKDVKTLYLKLDEELKFKSGQFMLISLPNGKEEKSFSISCPGEKSKNISITVKVYKRNGFTEKLNKLKIGDILELNGPKGHVTFDKNIEENLVMIAAGSGISTLHGIINYIIENKLPNKINLLYSVKNSKDIIYKEELETLSKNRKINYYCTLTKEKNKNYAYGRITPEKLKEFDKNSRFYIVGPGEFVKEIYKTILSFGILREKILFEIYGD